MDRYLNLTIVSPQGVVFEGKADRVMLPGTMGLFTILPLHAPLIAQLAAGKISYWMEKETNDIVIKSGFVEVKQDVVSVCIEQ